MHSPGGATGFSPGFNPGNRPPWRSALSMCLASCPNPPRRRPSSSAVFRVVRAKLPPIAFSMHPSSILANRLDPQPTRTKDDDEDEDEQEEGWDMALYRYKPWAQP